VTIALLDVNLLAALAWPNHLHHAAAHDWFSANRRGGWATCSVTQSGFVRVSSNSQILPDAKSPREAIELLREVVALPQHVFWTDDTSLARSKHLARTPLVGYRQVTDAHLLALALRRGGRLATFDGAIRTLVPDGVDVEKAVSVIPALRG
jgi:toxin-antitoxin system PIN domain toxin